MQVNGIASGAPQLWWAVQLRVGSTGICRAVPQGHRITYVSFVWHCVVLNNTVHEQQYEPYSGVVWMDWMEYVDVLAGNGHLRHLTLCQLDVSCALYR